MAAAELEVEEALSCLVWSLESPFCLSLLGDNRFQDTDMLRRTCADQLAQGWPAGPAGGAEAGRRSVSSQLRPALGCTDRRGPQCHVSHRACRRLRRLPCSRIDEGSAKLSLSPRIDRGEKAQGVASQKPQTTASTAPQPQQPTDSLRAHRHEHNHSPEHTAKHDADLRQDPDGQDDHPRGRGPRR